MNASDIGIAGATGQNHFNGIDGLRAIAVLAVMLYHLSPSTMKGGFAGVDVFFVISGFVVTASLTRNSSPSFGNYLLAFYARRFKRILPALIVCLCVTAVFNVAFIPNSWLSASLQKTALSAFFGWSNFVLMRAEGGYFDPESEFNPFTHTWSLAVEEQFYVLFPLLLYFWVHRPANRLAGVSRNIFVLLLVGSISWCAWVTFNDPGHAYYMLPSRFWELGVGAAAFLIGQDYRNKIISVFGPRLMATGGMVFVVLALALSDRSSFPFPWAIPAVLGSAMLIVSMTAGRQVVWQTRFLESRVLVAIGLLSYSLYLWHWPVYTLFRWTVGLSSFATISSALLATAGLAWISYRYVELPAQRHRWLTSLPPATTVAFGMSLIGVGWFFAQQIYSHPWRLSQTVVSKNSADWYPGPRDAMPLGNESGRQCTVHTSRQVQAGLVGVDYIPTGCLAAPAPTLPHLFVIGDSHTGAYARLLQLTSRATGLEITAYERPGCPVVGFLRPSKAFDKGCQNYQAQVIEQVLKRAKPNDVVWLASLRATKLGDQSGPHSQERVHANRYSASALADLAAAELEAIALVNRLTAVGLKVVIDAPKPVFPSPSYRCSDYFNRMNPDCLGGLSIDRDLIEKHRASVVTAINKIAGKNAAVHVWDPLPALCSKFTCEAVASNRPIFFDGDHLSGFGNEMLLPFWLTFFNDRFATRQVGTATTLLQ